MILYSIVVDKREVAGCIPPHALESRTSTTTEETRTHPLPYSSACLSTIRFQQRGERDKLQGEGNLFFVATLRSFFVRCRQLVQRPPSRLLREFRKTFSSRFLVQRLVAVFALLAIGIVALASFSPRRRRRRHPHCREFPPSDRLRMLASHQIKAPRRPVLCSCLPPFLRILFRSFQCSAGDGRNGKRVSPVPRDKEHGADKI